MNNVTRKLQEALLVPSVRDLPGTLWLCPDARLTGDSEPCVGMVVQSGPLGTSLHFSMIYLDCGRQIPNLDHVPADEFRGILMRNSDRYTRCHDQVTVEPQIR